jgi:tRNA pseudouridine38-40 synthase
VRTLEITIAYDGTRFVGWQRQAGGESIQGLIEAALARIEGTPVTVHGAGRTDAGVHALGQVASARMTSQLDPATLTRAINAHLPPDIRILAVEDRDDGFHARFSARSKCYRYRFDVAAIASPFDRAYAWHLAQPLDVEAMREAASGLIGTHDFAAFQSAGGAVVETVRTLTRSELRADTFGSPVRQPTVPRRHGEMGSAARDLLVYEVCGNGFLRHMVRAIAGTLVEVGQGRRTAASMAALLRGGRRADAGRTAPAHGLFLVAVDYD